MSCEVTHFQPDDPSEVRKPRRRTYCTRERHLNVIVVSRVRSPHNIQAGPWPQSRAYIRTIVGTCCFSLNFIGPQKRESGFAIWTWFVQSGVWYMYEVPLLFIKTRAARVTTTSAQVTSRYGSFINIGWQIRSWLFSRGSFVKKAQAPPERELSEISSPS